MEDRDKASKSAGPRGRAAGGGRRHGIEGVFGTLGSFVDLIGEMIETSQTEVRREGTLPIKGLGDKAVGVCGFSVRVGLGERLEVERFGNIRAGGAGVEVAEAREPLVDVFDEHGEILAIAELPGASEDEVEVAIEGDRLSLETRGARRYAKTITLPQAVNPASLRRTFRNGLLELRLKKA